MKKLKIFVGLILVFILGALVGSLGTEVLVRQKIENFGKHGPPPVTPILLRRLSHELDLTDTQKKDIEKIIDEMQTELHTLRQASHPEIQSIFEKYFKTIEEKLNDEQLAGLDRMKNDMHPRWRFKQRMGHGRGRHFSKDRFDAKRRKGNGFSIKKELLKRLTIALDLTEKQQTEIQAIIDQNFDQIKETLNDEQKNRLNTIPYPSKNPPGGW